MSEKGNVVEPDIAQLPYLEESMWRAETRFNKEWIERYFHSEFLEFGCSGKVYRFIDLIANGPTSATALIDCQFPLSNFTLSLIDQKTALVTYDSHVKYDDGMRSAHRMSVWLHNGDHWQMRSHQGTLM